MSEPDDLTKQLRSLAEHTPREAGNDVEERLRREFRLHHARKKRRRAYLAQAAALLIVAFALSFVLLRREARRPPASAAVQDPAQGAFRDFVPLPYAESGVPLGNGVVMRVELPVSDLSRLGIPAPPGQTRQRIGADLLIGQDGVARAVRFVQ